MPNDIRTWIKQPREITLHVRGHYHVFRFDNAPASEETLAALLVARACDPRSGLVWFDVMTIADEAGPRVVTMMKRIAKQMGLVPKYITG